MRKLNNASAKLTLAGFVAFGLTGCKDLTGSQALPAGTTDPIFYNTRQGALLERNAALVSFYNALAKYIIDAGLITDELQDAYTGVGAGVLLSNGSAVSDPLDERILGPSTSSSLDGSRSYIFLQSARGFASQAIGMLATYDTAAADVKSQKIMRAELYALTGYSEIMLADLFCSGVPLSTLDFQHDFTYHAGSSTAEVYHAAIAQFDTALMLADTSTQVQNLARVGLGRAWLDLGQYPAAADDVQSVPDGFKYEYSKVSIQATDMEWTNRAQACSDFLPLASMMDANTVLNCVTTVSDQEGGTGLPFTSSGDPRSADTATGVNGVSHDTMHFPLKYRAFLHGGALTLTIASGVEARLIQAEGALHAGDAGWITMLKTLHDTLPGVTPLSDPSSGATVVGSDRVALIFKERAEWLYLTGARQGDLRRQLRQYGQIWTDPDRVYPKGNYTAPGAGRYGSDVDALIPQSESVNPLFHGCLSRDP